MTDFFGENGARYMRVICIALLGASLAGCTGLTMKSPTASATTVEKLRVAKLAAATTGTFVLAPGRDHSMDTSIGSRGHAIVPGSGSFAQELRDEIVVELKASGLYDEKSNIVIEGQLTESELETGMGTGSGRLAAKFSVTRAGKPVYGKELAVEAKWDSSFLGAVAIPEAMNQYIALYKALAAKLFDDPEFRIALAP